MHRVGAQKSVVIDRLKDASDPVAYLCAWLALVPQVLTVVYTTLIWSSREIEIILMFAGQMGCEVLNFLLKRLIKGERPLRKISSHAGQTRGHLFIDHFRKLEVLT